VDDCLAIADNPCSILKDEIGKFWVMKDDCIGPPTIYLGGKCTEVVLDNGQKCWSFLSSQYVQGTCKTVRNFLSKLNEGKQPHECKYFMPKKQLNSPISNGYRPEIDVTDVVDPELASYYQSLIGILRWCNELGRVNITAEVSMLSSCMSMPREGHLKQAFMMFAYLERHHNAVLLFDPTPMRFDKENDFPKQDWSHSI